ncbi:MAG: hypothetical protein UY95_C0008G0009 [Parcubacteria group bacterium GW2011_GWA2_56_7]|nr:MAG: hypothetical protein UY95_C0008G0009 [Parcubacteria group bacterium GW2011_GWA2_56_7]
MTLQKPLLWSSVVLFAVLCLFLIARGSQIITELSSGGVQSEKQITASGEAKISQEPDIATILMGVDVTEKTVEAAQTKNTERMNRLTEAVKALGVPGEDLQTTSYNIYEKYEYIPSRNTSDAVGWTVSQTLEVTVRDLALVSSVLALAGPHDVTSLTGPNFEIENETDAIETARREAIEDAKAEAREIAEVLGVRLGKVLHYNEWTQGDDVVPYYRDMMAVPALGAGGAPPSVSPGTEKGTIHVDVIYKIR